MKHENKNAHKNWLGVTIEKNITKKLLMTTVSALLMSFPVASFIQSAGLLPGGVMGLAILIQRALSSFMHLEIPFGPLNIALSVLPAVIAFFCVGKQFVIFSFIQIMLVSIFVDICPSFLITNDILISTVFAAVCTGFGVVIALNAGLSTGGTDFIFMSLSAKLGISLWNYSFLFNALLLLISAFLFGVTPALYSVIYQYLVTKIISAYHYRYMKRTLVIIADNSEPIASDLMRLTKHSITEFQGVGKYTGEKKIMLYMVVTKDDMPKIKKYLQTSQQKVFMTVSEIEYVDGHFYLQPLE